MYGTWILWEIQTRKAFICFGASRSSQSLGCLYGRHSKLPRWTFVGAFRSQLRVETQAALWNDKKGQQLKRSNVCKGPPRLFLKICSLNMQNFRKPAYVFDMLRRTAVVYAAIKHVTLILGRSNNTFSHGPVMAMLRWWYPRLFLVEIRKLCRYFFWLIAFRLGSSDHLSRRAISNAVASHFPC